MSAASSGRPNRRRELHSLLEETPENIDWDVVLETVEAAHPSELLNTTVYDIQVGTFLHEIVSLNPPLDVVRTVIRKCPSALTMKTVIYGQVPLVLARYFRASPEIIRTLLHEQCELQDEEDFDLLEILQENDFWDKNFPLEEFQIFLDELPIALDRRMEDARSFAWKLLTDDFTTNHEQLWEKLRLFLMKTTMGTTNLEELEDSQGFSEVHSFLHFLCNSGLFSAGSGTPFVSRQATLEKMRCTIRILNMMKERVPDQFHTVDTEGSLPLHIAARLAHQLVSPSDIGDNNDESSVDSDSTIYSEPRLSEIVRYSSAVITFILEEYPESVRIPDSQGRLPLHTAIKHGLPCCLLLADAEPRAVLTRCKETRMYPFQLAACVSLRMNDSYEDTGATDTIYTLLRQAPHLLRNYRTDDEARMNTHEFAEIQQNKLEMAKLETRYKLEISQLAARNKTLKRKLDEMFDNDGSS